MLKGMVRYNDIGDLVGNVVRRRVSFHSMVSCDRGCGGINFHSNSPGALKPF